METRYNNEYTRRHIKGKSYNSLFNTIFDFYLFGEKYSLNYFQKIVFQHLRKYLPYFLKFNTTFHFSFLAEKNIPKAILIQGFFFNFRKYFFQYVNFTLFQKYFF